MTDFLKNIVEEWKTIPEYNDVEAIYWEPKDPQEELCPEGCSLEIYEEAPGWIRISGYDAYRQTRICRKHGYARIFVITGISASAHKWNPQDV